MNRLIIMATRGGCRRMAEAGNEGGGSAPAEPTPAPTEPTPAPAPTDAPAEPTPAPAPTDAPAEPKDEPAPTDAPKDEPAPADEPKSAIANVLGGKEKPAEDGNKPSEDEAKPAEEKPSEPKQYTDEDFTKAMVASDAVKKAAGSDKMELSSDLVKGMLPAIRKANLTPEQANDLANALAEKQVEAAKARAEERAADIKQMNDEAMRLFPDKQSWNSIGASMKHFFKPGGTMFQTIVHSELGSDPEFLALMKWAGERVAKDDLGGAAGSGGERDVSYEKALMGQ